MSVNTYALARGAKTMVLAKSGTQHPFDITTFAAHHWDPSETAKKQIEALNEHWIAVENRPPIVTQSPLIW